MLLPLLLSVYKDENSVLKFGDLRAECAVSETMIIGSKDLVSDTKARYTRAGQDKSLHVHHLKEPCIRFFLCVVYLQYKGLFNFFLFYIFYSTCSIRICWSKFACILIIHSNFFGYSVIFIVVNFLIN